MLLPVCNYKWVFKCRLCGELVSGLAAGGGVVTRGLTPCAVAIFFFVPQQGMLLCVGGDK